MGDELSILAVLAGLGMIAADSVRRRPGRRYRRALRRERRAQRRRARSGETPPASTR